MTTTLTTDETAFLTRMQPYFANGATMEEAARAVIADDDRIYGMLGDKEFRHAVRSNIARRVWRNIRGGEG